MDHSPEAPLAPIVIVDAGPIIAFARIGRLALLQQVIGEFIVPDAVYEELVVKGGDRPGAEEMRRGGGIHRQTVRNRHGLTQLPRSLGQGEREVIILAEEEDATLLVDDHKAREAAEQRRIEVVGSLWVLKEAKQRGMILAVRPMIEELLAIGYWFHPERVIRPFLEEMGELPPTSEPPQQ